MSSLQIDKHSLIVRIAYLRSKNLPSQVDRCTLVSRALLMFIPWMLVQVFGWFAFGLVLGVIAQPIVRVYWFIATGERLVYAGIDSDFFAPLLCRAAVERVTIFTYEREQIRWLAWIPESRPGGPRSPAVFFGGILCGVVMFSLLCFGVYIGVTSGVHYASETMAWWGMPLTSIILCLIGYFGLRKAYRSFEKTSSGKIIISYIKEWKSNHCPIYDVV